MNRTKIGRRRHPMLDIDDYMYNLCNKTIYNDGVYLNGSSNIFTMALNIMDNMRRSMSINDNDLLKATNEKMKSWVGRNWNPDWQIEVKRPHPRMFHYLITEMCQKELEENNHLSRIKEHINNKMKDRINQDKFLKHLIKNSLRNVAEGIERNAKTDFNLRTSEYSHYISPPMGNNEFLRKVVDGDIFKIEENGE